MYQRRRHREGDLSGYSHRDFTDWDNPEDQWEDESAPEGYYDEEADDSYVPDEADPDYDLSEAHGYAGWEPARHELIPRWLIAAASILLIVVILIPLLLRIR